MMFVQALINGKITVGVFATIFSSIGKMFSMMDEVIDYLKSMVENIGLAGNYVNFLEKEEEIKEKKPMAIFVAMGCPRQENFIVKYMDELPCKIFMGVGGSFDVIAEKVNRAPRWMINIGMEWAYRVSKEPWRIKRLGSIPKFIGIVIKNRGKKYER